MPSITVGPNEADNAKLGSMLMHCRRVAKLSRKEAAGRLDVSSEYIRLIEQGKRTPALGTAIKMFETYGQEYHVDEDSLVVSGITVKFTSRIKEGRHHTPELSRDELLGRIMSLLVVADDDTIRKIYEKL